MIPVRTRRSNFVYRGPTPDIGDAWTERVPAERAVYMTWQPSDAEREAIAAGGLIRLGIYGMEPIPPVSLEVDADPALGAEGGALRDLARGKLRELFGAGPMPPGHWLVATDVWQALNRTGALDGGEGLPLLCGRPLMEVPGADEGTFEYAFSLDGSRLS